MFTKTRLYKYLFILITFSTLLTKSQTQLPFYPNISFKYDFRGKCIDLIGRLIFKNRLGWKKIDATQQEEFEINFPILISYWKRQAPILFYELFSEFNCGFTQKNRTAIIFLGVTIGYGSKNFLLLGLNTYLQSEEWLSNITREDAFVTLVFHELLHIWVEDNINGKSTLLTKYAKEHQYVRDHIHLMALQKMIYLKINRGDILSMLDESYRKNSPIQYRRAWEIVNDIEGYEKIIQDIHHTLNP